MLVVECKLADKTVIIAGHYSNCTTFNAQHAKVHKAHLP